MALLRTVTLEELEKVCKNKDLEFMYRMEDPNLVWVRCKVCKAEFHSRIAIIKKGFYVTCQDCKEEKFIHQAQEKGLTLLRESERLTPNACDYRVYRINKCGHEKEMTLSAVRKLKDHIVCDECKDEFCKYLAKENGFTHVFTHLNSIVRWQCNNCGVADDYQLSNVRYGQKLKCRECKRKFRKRRCSFVYVFRITYHDKVVLKIGKSNSPTFRQMSFSTNPDVKSELLDKIRTPTESVAYELEHQMLHIFNKFRLHKDTVIEFMDSGYTECFDIKCLDLVLDAFAQQKENYPQPRKKKEIQKFLN